LPRPTWPTCWPGLTAARGQQIFEWFVDGGDAHIYERYDDSAAALTHVQHFVEHFAGRFLSLCTP
jgi:hypothetical protein